MFLIWDKFAMLSFCFSGACVFCFFAFGVNASAIHCRKDVSEMTYYVLSWMLNPTVN